MELTGKCIKVLPPLSGKSARTGETWNKYSFVLEVPNGQYSKKTVFTVFGKDKWDRMGIVEGGQYQVSFDIDAREYNGNWYNDIAAWKAVRLDTQQAVPNAQTAAEDAPASRPTAEEKKDDDNDQLPF